MIVHLCVTNSKGDNQQLEGPKESDFGESDLRLLILGKFC